MGKEYSHLDYRARCKLEALYEKRCPVSEIAKILGVHRSTIYREIKKGLYSRITHDYIFYQSYSAQIAQKKYDETLAAKGPPLKIGNNYAYAQFIEEQILAGASPDCVCGRYRNFHSFSVSTRTLYSYISKGVFLSVTNKNLLRKKNKRKHKKVRRTVKNPLSKSITERPEIVNLRSEFGHWEMDTVIGKREKKPCLLVLTERKTRYELVIKIPDRSANSVISVFDEMERRYKSKFPKIFKTVTVDNGSEFLSFEKLEKSCLSDKPRTQVYFCHSYSSWERGSNENANAIIRRYIPKGVDISPISKKKISNVQNRINDMPRKILGYYTAKELFEQNLSALHC